MPVVKTESTPIAAIESTTRVMMISIKENPPSPDTGCLTLFDFSS
jgi:hypothetical protein